MSIQAAKVRIDFEADTSEATRKLADFQGQVVNTTGRMRGAFQSLGPVLTGALGGFMGLLAAPMLTHFAGQVVTAGAELGRMGIQLRDTEKAFMGMSQQAGRAGSQMLDSLRKASGGAIADSALMQTALTSMNFGVTSSVEEMISLMDLAAERGQRMNIDIGTSFQSVITALGKANPESLEQVGIVVDSTTAYREYAEALGITAGRLTEVQKRQALLKATLAQAEGVGPASETVSEIDKATTAVQNLREELAKLLAPAVEGVAGAGLGAVEAVKSVVAPEEREYAQVMLDAFKEGYDARLRILEEYRAQLVPLQEDIARFEAGDYEGITQPIEELRHQQATLNALIQAAETGLADATNGMNEWSAALANNARIVAEANVAWEQASVFKTPESTMLAAEETFKSYEKLRQMASDLADELLPDLGPEVFSQIDEWGIRWTYQFDALVEQGYTADQAIKILAVDAGKLGEALLDAAGKGSGALATINRQAIIAQGGLAGAALEAENLAAALAQLRAVNQFNVGGVIALGGLGARALLDQQARDNYRATHRPTRSGMMAMGGLAGAQVAFEEAEKKAKENERLAAKAMTEAMREAEAALQGFTSSLESVPGLFGKSEVTAEQMAKAKAGIPQNFADDYLRRAKDELVGSMGEDKQMHKTDWAEVDPADIAKRLNLDPQLPGDVLYAALEEAWENSSLFADPANLDLINMDAVQKAVEQQEKSAQGEKNIKALFGIGDEETVQAVADLGLGIQTGLAAWVEEHGTPDSALALSKALGEGLSENGESVGGGVVTGLNNWAASADGKDALATAGEAFAREISKNMKLDPSIDVPTTTTPGVPPVQGHPFGGLAGALGKGGTASPTAPPVTIQTSVRSDHDVQVLARNVARIIQRGSV